MNYQDLVARAIAVKAADLEMGLSRAREQRPFVESVSRVLDPKTRSKPTPRRVARPNQQW